MRNVKCFDGSGLENGSNELRGNKGGCGGDSRLKMSNIDEIGEEQRLGILRDNASPTEDTLCQQGIMSNPNSTNNTKSDNPVAEAILVINSLPLSQDEKASYVRTLMSTLK